MGSTNQSKYSLQNTLSLSEYVKHYHYIDCDLDVLVHKTNDKEQNTLYNAYIDFIWSRNTYVYEEDYNAMCFNNEIYSRLQKISDRIIQMPETVKEKLAYTDQSNRIDLGPIKIIASIICAVFVYYVGWPLLKIVWWIIVGPFEAMTGIYISGRTPIISTQLSNPTLLDALLGMFGVLCILTIILTITIQFFKK